MTESRLRVAVLFPELLGTYGDGGNVLVLQQHLRWRGLEGDVVPVALPDPVPEECDLYLIGGGEDTAQQRALDALLRTRALPRAVARGATVLAVCAGLQMLGASVTDRAGVVHEGLGLLDATTSPRARRAVGQVVADPAGLGLPLLLGFENHGGGTRLGSDAQPLARVVRGVGNGGPTAPGEVPGEGAVQGRVVATYLHGPVLALNPALVDVVLSRVLGRPVAPLVLAEVDLVRQERLRSGAALPRAGALGRWWPR